MDLVGLPKRTGTGSAQVHGCAMRTATRGGLWKHRWQPPGDATGGWKEQGGLAARRLAGTARSHRDSALAAGSGDSASRAAAGKWDLGTEDASTGPSNAPDLLEVSRCASVAGPLYGPIALRCPMDRAAPSRYPNLRLAPRIASSWEFRVHSKGETHGRQTRCNRGRIAVHAPS